MISVQGLGFRVQTLTRGVLNVVVPCPTESGENPPTQVSHIIQQGSKTQQQKTRSKRKQVMWESRPGTAQAALGSAMLQIQEVLGKVCHTFENG